MSRLFPLFLAGAWGLLVFAGVLAHRPVVIPLYESPRQLAIVAVFLMVVTLLAVYCWHFLLTFLPTDRWPWPPTFRHLVAVLAAAPTTYLAFTFATQHHWFTATMAAFCSPLIMEVVFFTLTKDPPSHSQGEKP